MKDGEADSLKDSLKPKEGSNDDDVANVSSKATDDSSEKDTDMASEESKSSNPPDSDVAMSTTPITLVAVSEGVIPASVTKHIYNNTKIILPPMLELPSSHSSSTKSSPPSGI